MAMKLAVMAAAQRHCELIADLAAERPALGKAQMMGVAGSTTADQTSLLRHKAHMVAIADAPRLGTGENRFVDRAATWLPLWFLLVRREAGLNSGWAFRTVF